MTKELEKEVQKLEKNESLKKILNFSAKAIKAAENTKDEIMEILRKEIQKQTKEHFFELIWKKENYRQVKIDKNYNMSVLVQNGIDAFYGI
jgi:DNA sulfur modification protein DndD